MVTTEASMICKACDGIAVIFDSYTVTPTANQALAKTALRLAGQKQNMHFLNVASGNGHLAYRPPQWILNKGQNQKNLNILK